MVEPRYTVDHVQITVPRALAEAARRFYADGLGLPELPKPEELRRNGGAWFQVGAVQLHVSAEEVELAQNEASRRHVAYEVKDLPALERLLAGRGLAIIADRQPVPGIRRFYLRDPGGNRIEIFERTS
jgi:catechol 2,3-dioxygenase-like lactoylglutathione lyase family enzyme